MELDVKDFQPPWRNAPHDERKRVDRQLGARGGQNRVARTVLYRQCIGSQRGRVAILDNGDLTKAELVPLAETLAESFGDLRGENINRKRAKREAGEENAAANER
jgi:hypothetical protein